MAVAAAVISVTVAAAAVAAAAVAAAVQLNESILPSANRQNSSIPCQNYTNLACMLILDIYMYIYAAAVYPSNIICGPFGRECSFPAYWPQNAIIKTKSNNLFSRFTTPDFILGALAIALPKSLHYSRSNAD
ncbi:unnamed protein product [Meganyctiphanes norvegica]|uniref:Secreted protein n=1 Tax=Meganyctiphanes norvegica TaxID=48144 RepID=A0AAV2QCA5_MEGNR